MNKIGKKRKIYEILNKIKSIKILKRNMNRKKKQKVKEKRKRNWE